MKNGWVMATALLLSSPGASAPEGDLSDHLRRNSMELTVKEGRLGGPGARWLREEAGRAQFVFLGEEHGIAEIPLFTGALWREIHPLGYRHLALEEGPWLIDQADRYVRLGDAPALETYRASVVPNLPSASREHLAFFETLRSLTPKTRNPVVWGLDQEMQAGPLLKRLLALARTDKAREAVRAALAAGQAGGADLLGKPGFEERISAVRLAFGPRPGEEAERILDAMEVSQRIYDNNRRASKELTGYESNREREDLMKDQFLRHYREAQRFGEENPRVLLQFGSWHGMRGLSPTNVSSLGNFLAELAYGRGGRMVNIAVTCGKGGKRSGVNEEAGKELPCGADEAEFFQPILKAAEFPWTLFDLRRLRPAVHAGIVEIPKDVGPFVFQYDALLVIAGTTPMHFSQPSPHPE